jgi:hypothetical protein
MNGFHKGGGEYGHTVPVELRCNSQGQLALAGFTGTRHVITWLPENKFAAPNMLELVPTAQIRFHHGSENGEEEADQFFV